ncbi:hypothetical protein Cgig2_011017 [Carnegiea gigantea]|uniref:Non-specific serine/threonine protein kinase n=1 Tax=Carnegiea gigantea TaxID=171969 RepID=A0A9Q1KGC7_9CARY|nr:hypothetical protein Cgig2_011017 [Carnegiea gigantea]
MSVVFLHQFPPRFQYTNSSSILRVLSLSFNGLNDSSILQWVSNMTNISSTTLEYLDLSYNNFPGLIPSAFGNLGSLVHLDLSSNELQGPIPAGLGQLHLLSHLDLSSNALEGLVPGSIFELELLEYLSLASNNFQGIQFSNFPGSLCRLQTLNLGRNNVLNDFSSIMHTFSGCVNNSLVSLNISNNRFWGSIPNSIGAFSSLQELYLNDNQLNGTISPNLGQLSMLEDLDVSSNSLTGTLSVHHLSNLSRLLDLDLHDNPELMINISANWVPPFQLTMITLRSCNVGPYFPKWLTNQASLYKIDISNTGISDTIPTSLWNLFSSNLNYLNVSNNDIHGVLPNLSLNSGSANTIDLSSNRIEGAIPSFLGNATTLFLNDNKFYSSMAFFCPKFEVYVNFLDLSNNLLSGELPDCWQGFKYLSALRLDNNNFSGNLPPSMGALNRLSYLSMRNNSFNGELQISVHNWTELLVLDLEFNSFTGHVPVGIGSSLSSVLVLVLGNNRLSGTLPLSLCGLSNLQILDLSYNQISGTIPECICHLRAMTDLYAYTTEISYPGSLYGPDVYATSETIKWKRKEQSFSHTLGLVKYVAISNNQLQGHIPGGISCLKGVASLDFARNNLTGSIPLEIGELTSLEFLDLSRNHLSGQIPSSLAKLTFLGTLDVSYNNLSGKIPTGTQLQGLDPSAFMGNRGLCGPPLAKCIGDTTFVNVPKQGNSINREGENNGSDILPGLYISIVLGFIMGFWGVCGTLVIKRSWRHSYFRFVEDMYDRLYVMVLATIPRYTLQHSHFSDFLTALYIQYVSSFEYLRKKYSGMETCSCLLFLFAYLTPLSSTYTTTGVSLGACAHSNIQIQCVGEEGEALLNFKQGFQVVIVDCSHLWANQECFHWYVTAPVVSLAFTLVGQPINKATVLWKLSCANLSANVLEGLVPRSSFKLKLLKHFDLSYNKIEGIKFSNILGSLYRLQRLDLSNNHINKC